MTCYRNPYTSFGRAILLLPLLAFASTGAVLIDQIAVVVDKSIIKDSDIDRDIRVTQFLNGDPLHIGSSERKRAVTRLIDQIVVRGEIRAGAYGNATVLQAGKQLDALIKDRYHSAAALRSALKTYRLDEADLRDQFRWQLTVLQFIDARFRPAVVITDDELSQYYRSHEATLRKASPDASVEELKTAARDALSGEEIDRLFFAWLDQRRKNAEIAFHEEGLT